MDGACSTTLPKASLPLLGVQHVTGEWTPIFQNFVFIKHTVAWLLLLSPQSAGPREIGIPTRKRQTRQNRTAIQLLETDYGRQIQSNGSLASALPIRE